METQETNPNETPGSEMTEPLPFPFNQQRFCRYEPIEKTIEAARVLIVDNLLRDEGDLSELARHDWRDDLPSQLKRERQIASLALQNIASNVDRLVKQPATRVVHVTEINDAIRDFQPDAIVLSGTLRDFDYYRPEILEGFSEFIHFTRIPVLGICGGHQLIGLSFGARVLTLDSREQHERRIDRSPGRLEGRCALSASHAVSQPADPLRSTDRYRARIAIALAPQPWSVQDR